MIKGRWSAGLTIHCQVSRGMIAPHKQFPCGVPATDRHYFGSPSFSPWWQSASHFSPRWPSCGINPPRGHHLLPRSEMNSSSSSIRRRCSRDEWTRSKNEPLPPNPRCRAKLTGFHGTWELAPIFGSPHQPSPCLLASPPQCQNHGGALGARSAIFFPAALGTKADFFPASVRMPPSSHIPSTSHPTAPQPTCS